MTVKVAMTSVTSEKCVEKKVETYVPVVLAQIANDESVMGASPLKVMDNPIKVGGETRIELGASVGFVVGFVCGLELG